MTDDGDELERIAGELEDADAKLLAELESNAKLMAALEGGLGILIDVATPLIAASAPQATPALTIAKALLMRALERRTS